MAAAPSSGRSSLLRALNFNTSRDPLDTRPDTSGHVPVVHYNISPNDQQSYAGGSYGQTLGYLLNFFLHGGGQRQDMQTDQLIRMFRNAGMPSSNSNFIAENLVYRPYNRPT